MRFRSFYKLCAKDAKSGQREVIINPFVIELILRKVHGRWQHGEEVGPWRPNGRTKNSCNWDIAVPLGTKGLIYSTH
jgi:hypothetical protein